MGAPVSEGAGYSKREQRGWFMYDWANSAYATTVVVVFMGPYLTSLAHAAADASGNVHPFGIPIYYSSFWSYTVSLSVLLQVFFLPLLGSLADYAQLKKQMLVGLSFLGAGLTGAMYFLTGQAYLAGGMLFLFSNLAFGASGVFYDAFLPEIAPPEERDSVSSKGYATGYLGGGILLALNLVLYSNAAKFGVSEGLAVRLSLCSAGIWWGLFTLVPMFTLKQRRQGQPLPAGESLLSAGFKQFGHTLMRIARTKHTLLFLCGFLLYNDGIQTVITQASTFGQEELKLDPGTLTTAILLVQFVAFAGSIAFNWIAKWKSAKWSVMCSLVIWTCTLFYVYFFVFTKAQFYVMAVIVALVLGGSQALSRSIYSQMIPEAKEAEYMSLYQISDRGTSWIGPLLFGVVNQISHSQRDAIVSLIVFFIAGIALLARTDIRKASQEARADAA